MIFVAIGGFFGAISRFAISNWVKAHVKTNLPLATFAINLVGSFLLGVCIGIGPSSSIQLLVGTGFLGAFTTFSTFSVESVKLYESRGLLAAVTYLCLSCLFGILLAFAGWWVSSI
ncbi:fluoride efflux transporter CrcB [Metasolibacillus meyeri]|uniref:fluoride efflux transporter CrcB n=1 Tax=Metasolibacillus meyeri TaxID=1071052 RepID=UPI000D303385|nr:fluoride efflux transporter CrcB [Metasolibacillus meyeri]